MIDLFFINSPGQIFSRVIPLAESSKKPIFVIPKELERFFKKYYDNVVVTKVHPNLITTNTKRKLISNTIKAKKEFKELFSSYRNVDIYVFFTSWSITYFYYIYKLYKNKNKIHFVVRSFAEGQTKFDIKRSHRPLAILLHLYVKYIMGVPNYILYNAGGKLPICELDINKIKHDLVEVKTPIGLEKIPKRFKKSTFEEKVLFVCGEIHSEGAEYHSVEEITNTLKEILDKKYPESYAVKSHPRDKFIYGKMKEARQIDPETIFETMVHHKWKYVIGYYSETLIKAKLNTKAKVISLIHLYKWENTKLKNYWIEQFSKVGILMPETVIELDRMLR